MSLQYQLRQAAPVEELLEEAQVELEIWVEQGLRNHWRGGGGGGREGEAKLKGSTDLVSDCMWLAVSRRAQQRNYGACQCFCAQRDFPQPPFLQSSICISQFISSP